MGRQRGRHYGHGVPWRWDLACLAVTFALSALVTLSSRCWAWRHLNSRLGPRLVHPWNVGRGEGSLAFAD